MTSFLWSTFLLVSTGATGQVLQLARSLAMTSFFWSTFLLVATGATARKEFSCDVILLEYRSTGCYRCYSSQEV